ncbi:MAG: GAP family protein [Synechococcaceae cyanobacterium ELA263]
MSCNPALNLATLWSELFGFALAIGFSPLHIALLLLLLVGADPLRRGGWFVAGWLLISALEVTLLLTVGHGLLLSMDKGTSHRTGLDLLAAGVLIGVGMKQLLDRKEGSGTPAWAGQLDRFCAMPLLPLLGLSALVQVISPDDVFLYAKASGELLAADLGTGQELLSGGLFSLATGSLLLVPFLAVLLLGQQRVQPALQGGKQWLFGNADLIVGGASLLLALYFGWQGVDGLRLG